MKKSKNNPLTLLLIPLLIFVVLSGCELFAPVQLVGQIDFGEEFADETRVYNGRAGLIDFEDKLVGESRIKPLTIANTGEGPLVINNIYIDNSTLVFDGVEDASYEGSVFSFVESSFPSFPMIIPAGKTVNDIFVEFAPDTAGVFSSVLHIESDNSDHYFDLAGNGLWQLTLTVAGSGDDSRGKITSPIDVLPGNSGNITSITGIFDLASEIDFLYEFVSWEVVGTPITAPVFDNIKAKETTVTLKSHTEITIDIRNPFIRVGAGEAYATIQAGITACTPPTQIAVIVKSGTYSGNFTMKADVPVYGGYNADWSSRVYKTSSEREAAGFQTIVNGTVTSGSGVGSNVILEGFFINGSVNCSSDTKTVVQYNTMNAAGASAAVSCNAASNVIQNNQITGGSSTVASVGLECTNYALPKIRNNVIIGGSTSTAWSECHGIKVTNNSSPVIYKNTISGGTASGTGSDAFGVYIEGDGCKPVICGNIINGGSASADKAKSYGVYMEANGVGRVYASYNDINAGSGTTAYAMFVSYGGNLYIDYNNLHATGSSNGYGVFIGMSGRVRRLLNTAIYDCSTALWHDFWDGDKTDIDDVNDHYHTDTNKGSAITIVIPEEPDNE